jgi:hypothetical protein
LTSSAIAMSGKPGHEVGRAIRHFLSEALDHGIVRVVAAELQQIAQESPPQRVRGGCGVGLA